MFNPLDNNMIFSAGENDGIFIWQFHGDTQTNFFPQLDEDEANHLAALTMHVDRDALHEPSVLEKMRAKVQERRKPKLSPYSFIMPEFKKINREDPLRLNSEPEDYIERVYNDKMRQEDLPINHFVSLKEESKIKCALTTSTLGEDLRMETRIVDAKIVNGFDGFSGVHDNLIWNEKKGFIVYTLNNKVIFEATKTREQTVLAISTVRLSCLALSKDGKTLAAAEGE